MLHLLVKRLFSLIDIHHKPIIIIGDTMTDRWVHGRLASSQDDCNKFITERIIETPGGAANAARCLINWDTPISLFGQSEDMRPVKTRYLYSNVIVFRADDDRPCESESSLNTSRMWAMAAIRKAGAVLISDYDKGFLPVDYIRHIAVRCSELGVPCVADCKREPGVYDGCIIKGNADWNYKYKPILTTPNTVLTCGHNPPAVEGILINDQLPRVNCVNHVGAGDCFAAHLALALAYGFSLKEAAALAHSAGRVYVQRIHNQPPNPVEISDDLSSVSQQTGITV